MSLTHATSTNLPNNEASALNDASRRRSRRHPVRGICSMQPRSGPAQIFGGLIDVSPDGVLVKTEASLEVGARVTLQIDFVGTNDPESDDEESDRDSIEAAGIVRRQTDVDGRTAYGIEFVQDDTHRDTLLEEYEHSLK